MAIKSFPIATNLASASSSASVVSPALYFNDEHTIQNYNGAVQITFYVSGTFGTTTMATVNIQASFQNSSVPDSETTWFNVGNSFTAQGYQTININAAKFRAITISGDSGTSINVMGM